MKNNKGFTLIELLIVIAIISILLALSLIGIQGARQSSRDARRKADLESVRSALELYKADNGSYIITTGWVNIATGEGTGGTYFRSQVEPYMAEVPTDPSGVDRNACTYTTDNSGYFYRSLASGLTYDLLVGVETGESSCTAATDCTNPTTCYLVTNP